MELFGQSKGKLTVGNSSESAGDGINIRVFILYIFAAVFQHFPSISREMNF